MAQRRCPSSSIGVSGVETFVVLDEDEDIVFAGFGEEMLVLGKELYGRFGDQNMETSLDGVKSDWVMGSVWREDSDNVTR